MENKIKCGTILLTAMGVEMIGQAMTEKEGQGFFNTIKDKILYNFSFGGTNVQKTYEDMTQADWDTWTGAFTTTGETFGSAMEYVNSIATSPEEYISDITLPVSVTLANGKFNLNGNELSEIVLKSPYNSLNAEARLTFSIGGANTLYKGYINSLDFNFKIALGRDTLQGKDFIGCNGTSIYKPVVPSFDIWGYSIKGTSYKTIGLVTSVPYSPDITAGASKEKGEEKIPVGSNVFPGNGTASVPNDKPLTWDDIITGGTIIIPGKPPVGPDVHPPVWCNTNKELLLWAIGQKIRGNNPILPPGMLPTGDTETKLYELMEVTNG